MTELQTTEEYKPFQIMNASAGSGKTYNLVMSYLKLILGDKTSPAQFSKIMAMTFTNKAAFEMKSRIIEALDFLANPLRSSEKETKKAQSLLDSVVKELNIDAALLKYRAGASLKQILHQYEDFHVMTIDKFNLRLIRSFALDLDLDSDFQVVLNEEQILDKVIDQLMDELDPKEMKELTNLALQYSRSKIDDQESWDFQRTLKSFALVLTNEKYIDILKDIQQIDYSPSSYTFIKEKLKDLKSEVELKARHLHAEFLNHDGNTLPGKSISANAYEKLLSENLTDGPSDKAKGFFTNAMRRKLEEGKFPESLASQSIQFDDFFAEKVGEYRILHLISKNFYNMGLLKFISERLDRIRNSEQIIRISEFNKMISDLIKDEEAPFIYERLGNRFHHFLLDEFQDTSRLQWMNIVPLIHESLSNNRYNLIVGDPKQSIYRFKNGLAEQFITLPEIYNPEMDPQIALKSAYFKNAGGKKPLIDNWRSFQNIVEFNNQFFEVFKTVIPDELKSFYEDVRQIPQGKKGGYIYVDSKAVEKDEEDTSHSTESVLNWVNLCIADGIEKGDICILGATKKSCNEWAIALSNQGHKVVSSDSLMVHSDHQVKLAIAYLKWRKNPSGELEARRFAEMFFSLSIENPISKIQSYWKNETRNDGKTFQRFDQNAFIIENFGSKEIFFAPFESLYNLIQGFYQMANLHEIHNPYLHHLSDMLHEFDLVFGPELELFIKEYDQKGKNSSIQTPENKDAIKIMTGHKSKGLEFPVVMIPDLNWKITSNQSKFLLKEKDHFIYQGLSKTSNIDRIKKEYDLEYNQSLLDKLNLAYVMFTRPVERLHVGNYLKATKSGIDLSDQVNEFGKYIHTVFSKLSTSESVHVIDNEADAICFEIGEKTPPAEKVELETNTDFIPVELSDKLWFPDISLRDQLLEDENGLSDAQRYGNQLHLLLSVLTSPKEIEEQLQFHFSSGLIEQAFEERFRSDLNHVLSHNAYVELFQDAEKIWSEQAIIISATETKRPDKIILKKDETIVIDFKTGMANEKHLKQVQVYVNTLREMKYPKVRGIVFYTGDLRMVRAESV